MRSLTRRCRIAFSPDHRAPRLLRCQLAVPPSKRRFEALSGSSAAAILLRAIAATLCVCLPLSSHVFAQANTEDDVVSGQTDLTASATYTSGTPTTSSDVTFGLSGAATTYSPNTTFTLNTTSFNLGIGTLDDLDNTEALTIQNTTSGSTSTITLDGGANSVAPLAGGAAGDLLFVASGGTLTIGGGSGTLDLALASSGNFDIAGTATINSAISGTGFGFTMTGNGALTLAGANTYSGGTTVSSGTFTLASTGSIIATAGGFSVNGASTIANIDGVYTNTGSSALTVNGGGTLNFNGAASTSSLTGTSGEVVIGGTSAGSLNINGGTLDVDATGASGANPASVNGVRIGNGAGGNGILTVAGGTLTVSGGDEFLVGYNGATGLATVSSGTLNIGGGGGRVFIGGGDSGGTFGTGTLTISGGTVNIAAGGAFPNDSVYLAGYGGSGTLNLNGGLLSTARAITNGGTSTVNFNGGTLQAAFSTTSFIGVTDAYVLAGGATIDTQAYTVTVGQALLHATALGATLDGGLTKVGSGTLTLSASNSYTGPTTISAGTLQLGSGGTTGSIADSSALTNSGTFTLDRSNTVTEGTDFPAGSATLSSGSLRQIGTGTTELNGTNNYAGTTTVTAGTLEFTTETSLYDDNMAQWTASNIIVNSGATLAVQVGANSGQFNAGDVLALNGIGSATGGFEAGSYLGIDTSNAGGSFTYSNPITNSNGGANSIGLSKLGSGTLILTATNTYTGPTVIGAGGTLQIGNGSSAGTLGPNWVSGSGTLAYNLGSSNASVSNYINGSVGLTQSGTGILTLAAPNTYSGATVIGSGGTIQASAVQVPAILNPNFANPSAAGYNQTAPLGYLYYGSMTSAQLTSFVWTAGGGISNQGPAVFTNGSAWGYSTVPIGTQGLTLQETSYVSQPLTFAADGVYTLSWESEDRPGSGYTGGNTVDVDLNTGSSYNSGTATLLTSYLDKNQSSWVTYSTTIDITNPGTYTLTFAGQVSSADESTGLNNVTLTANNSSLSASSPVQITSGGTLDLAGVSSTVQSLANSGGSGGIVTNSGNTAATLTLAPPSSTSTTFSGTIQDGANGTLALVINGAGTQVLNNAETYTGGTTITAGTLQLGDGTTSNGSVVGNILDNAALVFANPTAQSYSGVISGSGTLRESGPGTLTITSAQSYTGATTVSSGTLRLSASSTNLIPNSSNIDVSGGTLDATGLAGSTLTLSTGQSLSGAGTVLGSVIIPSGGILAPGVNTNASGTFGAIGTLTLSTPGNLTINSGASLDYDLGSSGNGDLTSLAGALTLPTSGTINVNLANNANAGGLGSIGNGTYQILSAGSLTNAFSPSDFTIHASPLAGGTYTFSQVGNAIDLTITGSTGPASGLFSTVFLGGTGSNNFDASIGLNANKTYLNAVNPNGAAVTINGVTFAASSGGTPSGTGNYGNTWSLSGDNDTYSGFNSLVGGNLHTLLSTFDYNGNPAVLTETGLTPGQAYVVTFYNAAFDSTPTVRVVNFTTSDGITTPVSFDEDADALGGTGGQASVTAGQVNLLRYTFVATAPTESLTITPQASGTTMHVYGFSTEQVFNDSWVGGANWSTAVWNDSANNTSVTPNYAGSNAFFTAQTAPTTITLDVPETVGHIQFDGTNSWTIAGSNTLTLQTDPGGVSVLSALEGTHTIAVPIVMENNVMKTGTGTLVLSNAVTSNANTITIQNGTLQFGDGVANNGTFDGNIVDNSALAFAEPNAQSYGGTISGTGALISSGAGPLTLSGNNSYSGGTYVNSGATLIVSSDTGSVGSGSTAPLGQVPATAATNIVLNGGTLEASAGFTLNANRGIALGPTSGSGSGTINVASGATLNVASAIANNGAGTGNLIKAGAGTLVLNGLAPTYSGTTTINGGTLRLTSGNPIASISGLELELNSATGVSASGGVVTQWNDLSGNGYNATLVPAAISGSFTAPTYVNGKVVFSGSNVLMSNIPAGTFSSGFTEFVVAQSTNSNLTANEELVSRSGSGTNDQTNNNYPGPWDVRGNSVLVGNAATEAYSGYTGTQIATTMQTQSVLAVSGSPTGVDEYLNGTSTLSTGAPGGYGDTASYVYIGSRADGLTPFVGNIEDVLIFNVQLSAAQIQAISGYLNDSNGVLPSSTDVSITSGNLDLNGIYQTIGSLNTSSGTKVYLGGGTLTLADNNNSVVSGVISDTGGASSGTGGNLIKQGSGALTLNGANTYSGQTLISAGTIQLGNALALADSTVNIAVNGGLTFSSGTNAPTIGGLTGSGNFALQDLAVSPNPVNLSIGNNNASTTYSGALSGSGGITKVGTGVLTLSGNNTYGAATVINGGTLRLPSPIAGTNSYATSGPYTFTAANNNLLAGLLPNPNTNTLGGQTGNGGVPTGGTVKLTDGLVSNTGTESTDLPQLYTIGSGAQLTYTLGSSPLGYSLSQINIYSEWNDNGRSQITLSDISYSTIGNPTVFNPITNSSVNYASGAAENQASLTTSAGLLANDVYAVRFDFGTQENTWVGYSELEVVGTPTVFNNILPSTTVVTVAPSSTFDLDGENQQVVALSDSSPGSGGSVINSLAGTTSVLALSPTGTSTFSGMIGGSGGVITLMMSGTGTEVLAGANTYSGGTTVNSGILRVANTTGSATGTGAVSIGGSGTLAGSQTAGQGFISGAVTLASGATVASYNGATLTLSGGLSIASGASGNFNLSGTPNGSGSSAPLIYVASGTITASGNLTANFSGTPSTGVYDLVSFGSGVTNGGGTPGYSIGTVPAGAAYQLAQNPNTGELDLLVVGQITWTGMTGNSADSNWTTSSANTNWAGGSLASSQYLDSTVAGVVGAASVTFADTNPINSSTITNSTVNVQSGGVYPSSVTFTNNTVPYTINSSGSSVGIGGSTGITLNGNGMVTLVGANTYTGTTALNAGTLVISNNNSLGSSSGTIAPLTFNGGTLRYGSGSTNTDISSRVVTIASGGATIDINGNNVTYANSIGGASSNGSLTLLNSAAPGTPATLTLAAANNYSGGTNVNSGTLRVANTVSSGSATGGGLVTVNSGATLAGGGGSTPGFISGSVNIAGGATIAPSNAGTVSSGSIGTLTVGNLALVNGATSASQLNYQYNSSASPSLDSIKVSGALTLPTSVATHEVQFDFFAPGSTSPLQLAVNSVSSPYILMDYGSLTNTFNPATLSVNPADLASNTEAVFSTVGGDMLELNIVTANSSASWASNGNASPSNAANLFDNSANWTGAAVPSGAGLTATFDDGKRTASSVTVAVGTSTGSDTVGSLLFNSATTEYTLNGGSLILNNKGSGPNITVSTSLEQEINTPLVLADGRGTTTTFTISGANSYLDVFGEISEATYTGQNILLAGGGTLQLDNAANFYSGGTTVSGGTLLLDPASGPATPLGSGALAINGASSIVNVNPTNTGVTVTVGGLSASGGGTLNVAPSTTLTVNQTGTGVFAGTLSLSAAGSGGGLTVGSGTVQLNVASATTLGTGVTATVASGATLQLTGTVSALSDPSSGYLANILTQGTGSASDGKLSVIGATTQTVGVISGQTVSSSPTTYSGNTTVGDGTNAANLTATQILQNTLTINAGSTVTIAPSGSGIPGDEVATTSAAVSGVALAAGSSESDSDSSSDPFTAIQGAISSGSISAVKGQQLENRIAAIERLATTDPGLDVSLLEDRVLAALPSTSVWSSNSTSPLVETGSVLLAADGIAVGSSSDSALGSAAVAPSAAFGGSPAAVPEPSTLLLAIFGGLGLVIALRRRAKLASIGQQ